MSKLNPQIQTVDIGRRVLHEVTIYPLSLSDQFRTTDLISGLVNQVLDFLEKQKTLKPAERTRDIDVIKDIASAVEVNLGQILEFVVDSNEKIDLDDITNLQFSELADLIYEVNYSGAVGNFQGLIGKVKELFPSMGPSLKSSAQPATDLNISTIGPLGTEE
jgi:hypothetical protein